MLFLSIAALIKIWLSFESFNLKDKTDPFSDVTAEIKVL